MDKCKFLEMVAKKVLGFWFFLDLTLKFCQFSILNSLSKEATFSHHTIRNKLIVHLEVTRRHICNCEKSGKCLSCFVFLETWNCLWLLQ